MSGLSEDQLHGMVAQYLKLKLPADAVHHHSPNGLGKVGWRSKAKLKKFGTMTGYPDLEIIHRGRVFFIELKAPGHKVNGAVKGKGYLSPEQKACHARLSECGAPVAVCRSLDEVIGTLWGWNIIERTE